MATTTPRITARVDEDTQELLTRAAALSGMPSINAFVLSSAVEKAKKLIRDEEVLKLTERDAAMMLDALDRPAQANEKLKGAADRYNSKK
jgi:uncharacterized protein (DUF1778 family)